MYIDVPITGTNYHPDGYDAWCKQHGMAGLNLERDWNNPHDKSAVKVMCKVPGGLRQMGWIAKTHSAQVAELMLTYKLVPDGIVQHNPRAEPMKRLTLRFVPVPKNGMTPTPRHVVKVFGAPSQTPQYLETVMKRLPVGTVLDAVSTSGRTSIDLIYKTHRIAWFRKEEPDAELQNYLILLANRGALVARIETQNPLTCSLHRKGDIKAPDIENEVTFLVAGADSPQFKAAQEKLNPTPKENTMNFNATTFFSRLFDRNTAAAKSAAYLETGRIANNTIAKIVVGRLPFMARFYAKTPIGKLAIANAAMVLAQQVRPNDERLKKLSDAMTTVAYQELIALVDVEGMVDEFLAHPALQRALAKQDDSKE